MVEARSGEAFQAAVQETVSQEPWAEAEELPGSSEALESPFLDIERGDPFRKKRLGVSRNAAARCRLRRETQLGSRFWISEGLGGGGTAGVVEHCGWRTLKVSSGVGRTLCSP